MDSKHYNQMNWEEIESIAYADCDKPQSILSVHKKGKSNLLQVFFPGAVKVSAVFKANGKNKTLKLERVDDEGFFAAFFNYEYDSYTLNVEYENILKEKVYDPYSFDVELNAAKAREVLRGRSHEAYEVFGAHKTVINNVEGYQFVVYAPGAGCVSLVGDFNDWNEKANLMEKDSSVKGVYKLFIPGLPDNSQYKYAINTKGSVIYKNDPFSLGITNENSVAIPFDFSDKKSKKKEFNNELQIFEVDIKELFDKYSDTNKVTDYILNHAKKYLYNSVSFIHVFKSYSDSSIYEVINPYSLDQSNGFDIYALRDIVKQLKKEGIISFIELPLAFCSDCESSLMNFDGTRVFENEDVRLYAHKYYNAMLYDYTHSFTKSYLISEVNLFMNEFDFNGYILPNAGVMLYHDYNKNHGEYISEEWGNTLNSKGVQFIKDVNRFVHKEYKNALAIASIYAYYKDVTGKSPDSLCFDFCMNTGATNEIIDFLQFDPTFRREHLDSFLLFTHFTNNDEKYIYPYSRNENVKDNASIYDRMPGDKYQKLSNLKMAVVFKHLLKGAQLNNLDIDMLEGADDDIRKMYGKFFQEFRRVYEDNKFRISNFNIDRPFSYKCIDNQVITREYFDGERDFIIVFNFSRESYPKYTIPVTHAGVYKEVFNLDRVEFGGKGVINNKSIQTVENDEADNEDLTIKLPALSILAMEYRKFTDKELRDIFLKKKKAMIKFVDGEKQKIKDKLEADIKVLKAQADAEIVELEKLLEPFNEK